MRPISVSPLPQLYLYVPSNCLQVGIRRLLNNGTYLAAFPLHEGSYNKDKRNGINFDRRVISLVNLTVENQSHTCNFEDLYLLLSVMLF